MAVPDPQVLLLLGSGLTLLLALAVLVNLYPKLGLGLFILLAALWTNLRTPVAATLPLGELELSALDLLTVVMLGCGIFRALTARSPGRRLWPVWLLLAVMLVNVARGLSEHGLQRTGDEVRSWLYLLSIILFSATVAVTDARWWRRVASAYVGVLVVIALIGLAGTGLGAATTTVNLDGKLVDPRPLSSFGALVLADALLFLLGRRLHGRGGSLTAVAVLVATLVVLQQRTVWIAAAVACAYLGYLALRAGGRARLAASVGAALASVVVAAGFLTGAVQRSVVAVSAQNITQSGNTFAWRLDGWKDLLDSNLGLVQSVLGNPFGSGYRRTVDGVLVTVSPHSHYVETFLRFGGIGTVAFVVLAVAAWRAAPAAAVRLEVDAGAVRAVLVALLVAGVTYRWDVMQGLVLGTIIGAAAAAPAPGGPERWLAVGAGRRGPGHHPGPAGVPARTVGAGAGAGAGTGRG